MLHLPKPVRGRNMTKLTQTERLVKLETLMQQSLDEIKELRAEVKAATTIYVTIAKHEEDLNDIKSDLTEIKGRRWVQNTLSAILGAILSLLVAFFINNVGR